MPESQASPAASRIALPGDADPSLLKQQEEVMSDAQKRMESVLAATEVGTWTYEILANRVVADTNLSRMFGVTPEEAAGGQLEAYLRAIHPEDRARVEAEIAAAMQTGSLFLSEYRLVPVPGTVRNVLARGTVERDEKGQAVRLPGVILDITDRVQAETERRKLSDALEKQARMVDALLSSIVDFAYSFDREGRFIFINKALLDLLGMSADQVLGKTFFELPYPEELAAKLHAQIQQVVTTGQVLSDETPFVNPAGKKGIYEYIFTPVFSADGSVESVSGCTRDITERQATMGALQRSEENFRTLAETLPDTVWTSDPDGKILWTNDVLPRLTGLTPEEICGDGYRSLVHPEDAVTLAAWDAAREKGERVEYQQRVRQADGSWRWHLVRGAPARDAAGSIYRWIGTSTDIHDQRELNARLERSEREFRQLADSMPQIVWAAQPDGTLDYYNRRWFEYIDLSPEAVEEARWDLFIHPEDIPRAYQEWSQVLATGEPYSMEFRVRRADGEYRWFLVRALPMRDAEETITRWFGTCTDIHDQRELQIRLERSEALFRQHADTIPHLAWIANPDGAVTWYNHRWYEYTGSTPEEMKGWGWQGVMRAEELPEIVQQWEASLKSGQPFDMTFSMRSAAGQYRPFWTQVMPFRDETGEIVLWFGTNTDVSEQKRIMQERDDLLASERAARSTAEHASRMKDEFLATLSHELRSPLSAIFGWVQLLRQDAADPETLAEGLDVIDRNVRMQTQLIEDLLDMSRIISGKLRLDVQQVSVTRCIQGAIETVTPAAEAKGIRIERILDPMAGPVSGDPGRIQQILWNLLSNAIKFTPRGGKVQVVFERINSHVEISIADTGQGISPEFLPHVFDRFRQADAATNRKHGGLGLGLAIVKQLVELHGGTISVKSAGLGQGTAFIVCLPLKVLHTPEEEGEREHPRTSSAGPAFERNDTLAGMSILVVDDENDARRLLQRLLEESGARVIVAASAMTALDLLQTQRPAVLVSDIGMPEVDGYEFLRRVRALPPEKGGRVPAVALTAFARSEDRTRALVAGFLAHVSKPVEPAELIATIVAVAGSATRE